MNACLCVCVYVSDFLCSVSVHVFCECVHESEFIHMPDGVGRVAEAMCVDTCNNGDGC